MPGNNEAMSKNPHDIIKEHAQAGVRAREAFFASHADAVCEAARAMASSIAAGGKILICGNGGSAADAQHMAAEFVNRFMMERPPLPAVALTTDSSALTAISNDYSFSEVFSKQVLALGARGDILIGISTSGSSPNILAAIGAAKEREMSVIGITGKDGGAMAGICDFLLNVENVSTPVIQEVHLAVEHLLCRLCDYFLFENVQDLMPWLATE